MKLRYLTDGEIESLYPNLFRKTFQFDEEIQKPSTVVVIESENKIIAFLSGYWQNKISFYVQYCGVLPDYPRKGRSNKFLKMGMNFIGARFYSTRVPNWDIPIIKILLSLGFIIHGISMGKGNILFLELSKDMEGK